MSSKTVEYAVSRGAEMGPGGSPVPSPIDPFDAPEPELGSETMLVNVGPQHPATHGVLRLIVELDGIERGERPRATDDGRAVLGHLHTPSEGHGGRGQDGSEDDERELASVHGKKTPVPEKTGTVTGPRAESQVTPMT